MKICKPAAKAVIVPTATGVSRSENRDGVERLEIRRLQRLTEALDLSSEQRD